MFENFLTSLLLSIYSDKEYEGKNIILYLDNARIH